MARTGKKIKNMGREELLRTFADSFEKVGDNFNFLADLSGRLADLEGEHTEDEDDEVSFAIHSIQSRSTLLR